MKLSIILIAFSLIINFEISAQIYDIQKGSTEIEGELRPALKVKLEPSGKETSKEFKSYLKDKHDVKLGWLGWKNRSADEVSFPAVSKDSSNLFVYTQFEDLNEGSQFYITIAFSDGTFANFDEHPQVFENLDGVITHFLSNYLPGYINNQINTVNKEISSLDKDLKKARKKYNSNQEDIKSNEEEIESLKQENYEMEKENKTLKETISEKESKSKEQHEILFEKREHLEKTKQKLLNIK